MTLLFPLSTLISNSFNFAENLLFQQPTTQRQRHSVEMSATTPLKCFKNTRRQNALINPMKITIIRKIKTPKFCSTRSSLTGLVSKRKFCNVNNCNQLLFALTFVILSSCGLSMAAGIKPGLIKLCPPGGESFASAWQMTCGMRRKRSSPTVELSKEIEFGGETEWQKSKSAQLKETMLKRKAENDKSNYYTYSNEEDSSDTVQYQPFSPSLSKEVETLELPNQEDKLIKETSNLRLLLTDPTTTVATTKNSTKQLGFPELEEVINDINNQKSNLLNQIFSYRPPSITEMMVVCCKYGCSLRDLLPYCSPFGEWEF